VDRIIAKRVGRVGFTPDFYAVPRRAARTPPPSTRPPMQDDEEEGGGCLDRRSWTPRTDGGSPHTSHSSVSPCTGRR